jgi:hypothetical protein
MELQTVCFSLPLYRFLSGVILDQKKRFVLVVYFLSQPPISSHSFSFLAIPKKSENYFERVFICHEVTSQNRDVEALAVLIWQEFFA